MEKIWLPLWPKDIPRTLRYHGGAKPLFEYLRQWAKEEPDKPAIIFYGKNTSYRALDETSDRFATFLLRQGLKKGDRVAIYMQDSPHFTIALYGSQKVGMPVAPCSPMYKEWELEHQLNDSGAKLIVCMDRLYPILQGIRKKVPIKTVVIGSLHDFLPKRPDINLPKEFEFRKHAFPDTVEFMEILDKVPPERQQIEINLENDIALLPYTGGSTGVPKGVMHSYGAGLFKAACWATVRRFRKDERVLAISPLFHMAGLIKSYSYIYSGTTQIMMTRFDPLACLQAIERYKVTGYHGPVPTLIATMEHPEAPQYDLSSLRWSTATSFGVPLTKEIALRWKHFTKGCTVIESAYGTTESHDMDCFMPPDQIKYSSYSIPCGIPSYEQEFKIVDLEDNCKELPIGEPGEVVLRNPSLLKGYWRNPEATEQVLRDGWFYTGDIGKFDKDGYFYLLGRKKELIKVSGFSVFPDEIEIFLNRHPVVAESAVVGIPHETRGEVVKAFIVLNPEHVGKITGDEIIEWAKDKMSPYKVPKIVEFRDKLPYNEAHKVVRRLLK
jgi:long-chain acyl-CoA synthetase